MSKSTPLAEPLSPDFRATMGVRMGVRLEELRNEFQAGQKMLVDLNTKRAELEATMLRISGAAQVIEEMLNPPPEETKAE